MHILEKQIEKEQKVTHTNQIILYITDKIDASYLLSGEILKNTLKRLNFGIKLKHYPSSWNIKRLMDSGLFFVQVTRDVSKYILQYNHTWDFVAPVGAVIPFFSMADWGFTQ